MAEDRDQGPHYIPELDPERPESGPRAKQRALWFLFICGSVMALGGGGLYVSGVENAGMTIGIIGLILLALLMPFGLG